MICMSMNKNKKKEREKNKALATYRIRTRPHRMRDALRRLSESFRDRLKRFDSTHNTDKYVRVYMCFLFVLTLRFSHTQKRPLVYVLRIIISFLFFSFSLTIVLMFSIGLNKNFFLLVHNKQKRKRKE
jgi:hypothetical protein